MPSDLIVVLLAPHLRYVAAVLGDLWRGSDPPRCDTAGACKADTAAAPTRAAVVWRATPRARGGGGSTSRG